MDIQGKNVKYKYEYENEDESWKYLSESEKNLLDRMLSQETPVTAEQIEWNTFLWDFIDNDSEDYELLYKKQQEIFGRNERNNL